MHARHENAAYCYRHSVGCLCVGCGRSLPSMYSNLLVLPVNRRSERRCVSELFSWTPTNHLFSPADSDRPVLQSAQTKSFVQLTANLQTSDYSASRPGCRDLSTRATTPEKPLKLTCTTQRLDGAFRCSSVIHRQLC